MVDNFTERKFINHGSVNGANGHLVYVRRKHETESEKFADSSSESPAPKKPRNDLTSVSKLQSWKERFGKLQNFLKACDQSNLEEYIQKIRSVSPADRSKLAYQLEKRSIQLTLEEGKELHRVRVLNVLGKVLPDRPAQIRSHVEVVLEEQ